MPLCHAVREHFAFDKVLGKGNFGVVHLVRDKKTNQPYACKSISKRKMTTPDDLEDVKREIQILLHLSGHPNVVQIKVRSPCSSHPHPTLPTVQNTPEPALLHQPTQQG